MQQEIDNQVSFLFFLNKKKPPPNLSKEIELLRKEMLRLNADIERKNTNHLAYCPSTHF